MRSVGFLSLVLIFGLRFVAPRVPRALVLVIAGLIASAAFGLGDRGLALIGDVPSGLPSLALPDLKFIMENLPVIVAAAKGILLIGFSQSAGDARAFAAKHKYRVDINQESVAQGMANVGSSLVQGIPVSTSLSASSLNDASGAKTPVASLTTGALIILTLLLLAPLFSGLPKAVLAALIIELHHQADPKLRTIVLDFEGVNFIDSQGAETLAEIIELATSRDIELRLTRVKTKVKELLQRDGVIDRLGESRIYGNVYEAAADRIPDAAAARSPI